MKLNLCMGCMSILEQPGPCPVCGFDPLKYECKPHDLPLQTILAGKYLIGKVLGQGGFGITYLGWDLSHGMKVAVKEYYPNGFVYRDSQNDLSVSVMSGERGFQFEYGLKKFVDEANRLARFRDLPGIVSVLDYFTANHTAYIVMEFASGETLKAVLKKNNERLDPQILFAMIRPLMNSLQKVHEAGLIHRDISPDNIMVDDHGNMKLLDFGAARDFMSKDPKSLSVLLKPGYAPEEQYRRRGNQGPWTDVYALCATIYRALCGKVPEEALERIQKDELKPPSAFGVRLGDEREKALMKGLSVFAGDRWASVGELQTALYDRGDWPEKKSEDRATVPDELSSREKHKNDRDKKKKRPGSKGIKIAVAVVAAVCIVTALWTANCRNPSGSRISHENERDMETRETETSIYIGDAGLEAGEDGDIAGLLNSGGDSREETGSSEQTGDSREETEQTWPEDERMRLDTSAFDQALSKYGNEARFGICIFDIPTDVSYTNGLSDTPMKASALTNVCILFSVAWLCDNNYMTLDDKVVFQYTFDGRGIHTQEDDGKYFTAGRLLEDMLMYSDNNAANAIMNYITIDNINAICTGEYNFSSVDIQCCYGSSSGDNYVSANDIAVMLYLLYSGNFDSIDRDFMEKYFAVADSAGDMGMMKYLSSGDTFLNHNGIRSDQYNEAMLAAGDGYCYVFVALSDQGSYEDEAQALAQAARIVHRDLAVSWP